MNEAELIQWISKHVRTGPPVLLGIGDDAAVVRSSGRGEWVLKTDMVVEGVHFSRKDRDVAAWGRKAILTNVSDFAAMAAEPRYALVALGLPRSWSLKRAERLYGGMLQASREFGIKIIGGDTSRAGRAVIAVSMMGHPMASRAVTRKGARPGDVVFVTGPLGGSLRTGKHLRFKPRLKEARFLIKHYHVRAMIDLSDGLSTDIRHLARESRVGFRLFEDQIPRSRRVSVLEAFTDGEDFELVFTLSLTEGVSLVKDPAVKRRGLRFYPIGRVVPPRRGLRLVGLDGREKAIPLPRDHHFG